MLRATDSDGCCDGQWGSGACHERVAGGSASHAEALLQRQFMWGGPILNVLIVLVLRVASAFGRGRAISNKVS